MMYKYLRWVASSSFLRMASCRLLTSSWTFSCSSSCLACTKQEAFPAAALCVMHSAFGCNFFAIAYENRCSCEALNFSQGMSTNAAPVTLALSALCLSRVPFCFMRSAFLAASLRLAASAASNAFTCRTMLVLSIA